MCGARGVAGRRPAAVPSRGTHGESGDVYNGAVPCKPEGQPSNLGVGGLLHQMGRGVSPSQPGGLHDSRKTGRGSGMSVRGA